MERAKPIVFRHEDTMALPPTDGDSLTMWLENARLPFPCVYVDLGGGDEALIGALVTETKSGHVWVWPCIGRSQRISSPAAVMGAVRLDASGAVDPWTPLLTAESQSLEAFAREAGMPLYDFIRSLRDKLVAEASHIVSVLCLLESPCAVVQAAETSRQERRDATRKGIEIALSVTIRPRKGKARGALTPSREYTHRFDRRGSWAHYGPETKIGGANPGLIRDWPGRPQSRRVWRPPTIVGDVTLPYVPKVRLVHA